MKTKKVDELTIFALDKIVGHEKRIKVLEELLLHNQIRRTSYEEVDRLFQSYYPQMIPQQPPIPPPRVSSIRSEVVWEKTQTEEMDRQSLSSSTLPQRSSTQLRRSSVDLWLQDLYSVQKSEQSSTFRKFLSSRKLSTVMSKSSLSPSSVQFEESQ